MIIGLLSDLEKQKSLLPAAVVRALEILQQKDLANMEAGRIEIEGDKLFYMVQDAMPRFMDGCQAEAHKLYADIQLPISAPERANRGPPGHRSSYCTQGGMASAPSAKIV